MLARSVIEVALGKKSGGSRLVGIGVATYRIWARVRYRDCCEIIESRIARPYLFAAPSKGASNALVDAAFHGEVANAKGHSTAASLVDLAKFYEVIEVSEFAKPGIQLGIPIEIILLTSHTYLGPRRIRVAKAVSSTIFPRRSVIAGCTFAMVHIRVMVIPGLDIWIPDLKRRAGSWEVDVLFNLYVDDGALLTSGYIDAVTYVHAWATNLLLDWVRLVINKQVTRHKLQCIVSSNALRQRLSRRLHGAGFRISLVGDLLGGDFTAGGKLTNRFLQRARWTKNAARLPKIQWFRKHGGNAGIPTRNGLKPGVTYGSCACGLPPVLQHRLRRAIGSVDRVSAAGSSLTARLALGGVAAQDIDPAVIEPNPPLKEILRLLWDQPSVRRGFIWAWRFAQDRIFAVDNSKYWNEVRGPVSGAAAHLRDVDASWSKPFVISCNGHDIDILATPPLQVYAILKEHARVRRDHLFLTGLARDRGWNVAAVNDVYKFGIDWWLLRRILGKGYRGRDTGDGRASLRLTPVQKRAFEIVAKGAYSTDADKWLHGYTGHGTCRACLQDIGFDSHILHLDCSAMAPDLARFHAEHGRKLRIPDSATLPGREPLLFRGLPPRAVAWSPCEVALVEGGLSMGHDGKPYGDGSCSGLAGRNLSHASWAVVRLDSDDLHASLGTIEAARGSVLGWSPSLARAELHVLSYHLQHVGVAGVFVGDCRYALEGASQGVPLKYQSAASWDADL